MYIGESEIPFDDYGTTPIIKNNRALVPIRAIIENLGGEVEWDNEKRRVTCRLNGHNVQMWINSVTYYVDYSDDKTQEECRRKFEVAPIIHNNRTMIPIRSVLEALGCTVIYEENGGKNGWNMISVTSPIVACRAG
jgi:hypothetical protein